MSINFKKIDFIERYNEIDFIKGVLVIFMVIYHSLNYHHISPNRYLQFVTPSFIMISGYIIAKIYFPKYLNNMTKAKVRLAVRALKIILIFIFLNILKRFFLYVLDSGNTFDIKPFYYNWTDIYLIGGSAASSFDILLPISYTMLLSTLIFYPKLLFLKFYISIGCVIIFFGVLNLMWHYGMPTYNLSLMSAGAIGIVLGLTPNHILKIPSTSYLRITFLIVMALLCLLCGHNYYTQILSTILALLIFHSIGINIDFKYLPLKHILLLGQYSLLGYILQIAYLNIFFNLLIRFRIKNTTIIITILLINLIVYINVLGIDFLRRKSKYIDYFYKAVFL